MLFGTDGYRGIVDKDMNSDIAYKIGKGLAIYLLENNLKNKVIIGGDTRLSTDCYITSVASALLEYGINVDIVGVVSSPMISFLVNRLNYSAGIMVTASHNDNTYNGIKVFNRYGEKANSQIENEIEQNIEKNIQPIYKGKLEYKVCLIDQYEDYLYKNFINKFLFVCN